MKFPAFVIALPLVYSLAAPLIVTADSLYPVNVMTGAARPLRLESDRRASQIGDLVAVQFDFSVASSSSLANAQKKDYALALSGATGNAALLLLRNPATAGGSSSSDSSHTKSDASSFATTMTATVIGVLPSGALRISGEQKVAVDGQNRVLHVTGSVRPEDIDNTDTVLSTRIADVDAHFDGDNKTEHHGLIQKVLDVLF